MVKANKDRLLPQLIAEIAQEKGIKLHSFSQNWILRMEQGHQARHIFGYNFEINSATAEQIAGDKAAVADLLQHTGIPHVAHVIFHRPGMEDYVPESGNWSRMLAYAAKVGFPLVCKPNNGTGGSGVSKVNSVVDLEAAVQELFRKHRSISLSPYLEIEQEFRAVMLDGVCELLYAKSRPQVTGDGRSNLLQLIEAMYSREELSQGQAGLAIEMQSADLQRIPANGEQVTVGWKHNLGQGSEPVLVQPGGEYDQLAETARRAAAAINIRFASVDMVCSNNELMVLEINSGIMMEYFAAHSPENRAMAKRIYTKAIDKMFAA